MRKELFLNNIRVIKFAVGAVVSVAIFIALVVTFALMVFPENITLGVYLLVMTFISFCTVMTFLFLRFYQKMNYDFTSNGEQITFLGLKGETVVNRSKCEKIYVYSTSIQIKCGTTAIWLYNYEPVLKKSSELCIYDERYLREHFPNAQISRRLI
ncbi:MAG: hypothetical protein J1F24_02915 [Oscillospiraceae bacterium]|nr:hypothetical protein [Oscillospiraceae bacterium]